MQKFLLYLFMVLVVASCKTAKQTNALQGALSKATVQHMIGGVEGSGQGMVFKLAFYKIPTLQADTLWVNEIAMETEINTIGDTTYIASFYHNTQPEKEKPLLNDEVYSGRLRYYYNQKKQTLEIKSFKKLEPVFMP